MSSSRSSGRAGSRAGRPDVDPASRTSLVRTGLALLLVLVGVAWVVVYVAVADPAQGNHAIPKMTDLGRWNYLIGFALLFIGLAMGANPSTPLGRGRGVVIGMLGCFLLGLLWIVVYYVVGTDHDVPLVTDLQQYNLIVGIGFMAVGFVYATHWE